MNVIKLADVRREREARGHIEEVDEHLRAAREALSDADMGHYWCHLAAVAESARRAVRGAARQGPRRRFA